MVGSTGVRLGLINPGDWSDGLGRKGSNPLPTTKLCPSGVMVASRDLKSLAERRAGSNPASGTSIAPLAHGWLRAASS